MLNINKNIKFTLIYGVTKVDIKVYQPMKYGDKSLIFHNKLSLKKILRAGRTEAALECRLYGEGKKHMASMYLKLKRQGDCVPKYNVFALLANSI